MKRTIAIGKNFPAAPAFLGNDYEDKGMYEEAISEFQTVDILTGSTPEEAARRAEAVRQAYRTAGAKGYWQKVLELNFEDAKRKYIPPYKLAGPYARVGDKERMYEWLQKAYDDRSLKLVFLKVEPAFEPYRSEPRFQELMRKVGIPK
jgi:tetratricopeptide (TPR) repeat protein